MRFRVVSGGVSKNLRMGLDEVGTYQYPPRSLRYGSNDLLAGSGEGLDWSLKCLIDSADLLRRVISRSAVSDEYRNAGIAVDL